MPAIPEVLHYVGCDDDRGGIVSVVRNLAGTGRFPCVLGVNPGCVQRRSPALPALELPRTEGEKIGLATFWRARTVAGAVQGWLRADPGRIFHGHSRAGLLVGLWLYWRGERRVVVSVHCYGRQRWFYRWAAGQLGKRLFWLSPAMKAYYGAGDRTWAQCVPGGVPPAATPAVAPAPGATIRLGGAGALVRWKQWHLVPEALTRLPEPLRARFHFEHIGGAAGEEGETYARELRELTQRLGLAAQVRWRGAEPSAERLLHGIDALVTASRNEPFSIALLEALAAGVPVLAADSGGTVDVVRPGTNGWLFRSGDAGDLARVLALLPADPVLTAPDRARIRATAFTAGDGAAQWEKIYAAL